MNTIHDAMTIARFWTKVDVRRPGECWVWKAALNEMGYGVFRLPDLRLNAKAHRMAWEITHDESLSPDVKLLHSCDNPPCCNPAHLRKGTQQENIADMVARGRQRGSRHSRLSRDQVSGALSSLEAGETQTSVALRLGVSPSYISMIASGKRWRSEEGA